MNQVSKWTAPVCLAAFSLLGCQPPTPPPAPPPPATPNVVPVSRAESTAMMADHAKLFSQFVAEMPGDSGTAHRQLLVQSLGELSLVLQSANGPEMSPEFDNSIKVIDSSAKTAGDQTIPRARMEAVENEAIQSAAKAMDEIGTRYLYQDDQLPPMLDAVHQKVDSAVTVMGPMHDLDATEAFRAIEAAVQRMTADMEESFGGPPAGEAPAVAPTPTPATLPATMP